ncbi:MAG: hypothetical protein JO023_08785 [Chloroflexi bacterium]|nr:hypothetical protein [Chloroflexota bacterium]
MLNAIARATGGNFRLVQRLFAQIERIVTINDLPAVTTEVVTLARERLVEGCVSTSIFSQELRQSSPKITTLIDRKAEHVFVFTSLCVARAGRGVPLSDRSR